MQVTALAYKLEPCAASSLEPNRNKDHGSQEVGPTSSESGFHERHHGTLDMKMRFNFSRKLLLLYHEGMGSSSMRTSCSWAHLCLETPVSEIPHSEWSTCPSSNLSPAPLNINASRISSRRPHGGATPALGDRKSKRQKDS